MKKGKKGFTMIELMLVISIMAILATLSVGGYLKMLKQARNKRVDMMRDSLQLALTNFRGQEGRWPVGLQPAKPGDITVWFEGAEKNWLVFQDLINSKQAKYLTPADYLTKIGGTGRVVTLQEAIDGKDRRGQSLPGGTKPLGYANPDKPSSFQFFRIEFNLLTDSVAVHR